MLTSQQTIKIKQAMMQCGKSQTELARELGCSRQYLNGVINGKKHNPSKENKLIYWAASKGVSVI